MNANTDSIARLQNPWTLLLQILTVVMVVICTTSQLQAVLPNESKPVAYKLENCTGTKKVFNTVSEMLRSIDNGNEWKSFKMDAYTENPTPPISSAPVDCAKLTPETIIALKTLDDGIEELVVVGVRLTTYNLYSVHRHRTNLEALEGKIPLDLYNKYQADLKKALEEFKQNLNDCFFDHFPEFASDKTKLNLDSIGESLGSYSNGTITLYLQSINHGAYVTGTDLYTYTQNVILHEYEHHRTRENYWYKVGNKNMRLWADWERDTQEVTHHRWWHVFQMPPPQYYTKQEPFDTVLSRLISEIREELGDASNDFSDDRIQAQYIDMFEDFMSRDDKKVILGTPFNKIIR